MVIKILDCDGPGAWGVHFKDNSSLSFVFYFPVTVQIGLNIGVVFFIIIEALFFLAIFFTLSGHILLNILSGFTYNIMYSGLIFFILGLLPLAFIIGY